jgi:regulator of ribonuclease activity A
MSSISVSSNNQNTTTTVNDNNTIRIPFQPTCDVYDQYWDKGSGVRVPDGGGIIQWKSYGGTHRFCGTVTTIQCYEDNTRVKEVLEATTTTVNDDDGTGRVLVVDGGGRHHRCALLGDVIATAAVQNHWDGIIVYGCVRDVDILKTLPIGIMAIGNTPKKSIRNNQGQINVPLSFGNISINGDGTDCVFADNDGIVFMKKHELLSSSSI